jgi:cation transport regulator ChaC
MTSFLYFAYGSNMLTARLRERCPGATPVGLAYAHGFSMEFWKEGRDGSGKATLVARTDTGACVHGVLYRIDIKERADLDLAEARYDRHSGFAVAAAHDGCIVHATTYIAPPQACNAGLRPFDWYVALIRAGAAEHGLDQRISTFFATIPVLSDPDQERAQRMFALAGRDYL